MEKEFVPVELALKLKSLGFDDVFCFAVYNPIHNGYALQSGKYNSQYEITILAPLWQQAFDWFREKYNCFSIIDFYRVNGNPDKEYLYSIDVFETGRATADKYNSFNEARLACLEKLIELTTQH